MTPELQSALNQALAVLVPAVVAWIVAKIKGDAALKGLNQVTKDTDAAFQKIRAAEEQLGIQTRLEGGKLNVYPALKGNSSIDSKSLHKEGG